jgi:hypothetical protein
VGATMGRPGATRARLAERRSVPDTRCYPSEVNEENVSERAARATFESRCGLEVRRIPTGKTPSPDWEVRYEGRLVFVAEVKGPEDRTPIIEFDRPMPSGLREDNGPWRVSRMIVKAARQLAAWTGPPCPKALVILNEELNLSFKDDLVPAILGYRKIDDTAYDWVIAKEHEPGLREAAGKIDFFVWLERHVEQGERDLWYLSRPTGWDLCQRFFRAHVTRP